ncbi:MAG TPA: nucleotide sugar dehydrogenase [Kiritimatiellia bacterium]|nr:nucleotide sugar dehydrogenase [Kiritimatiellia bacterium]
MKTDTKVAVIGLGYVGLPLAVEFGKKYPVVGFDLKPARIAELREGRDSTEETTPDELAAAKHLSFTCDPADLKGCQVFIVCVPTPVDEFNRPDLSLLVAASRTAGQALSPGGYVVFESTVYPGATEEVCVPEIEKASGLTFNRDFFVGYSPERINPGDKAHRLPSIVKVTSGSTPEAAEFIDQLYASIITAGTHRASSIRVAEAAKVIENTQRDVNIALMNELALLFARMGIDTGEVLAAAGTKWNFLRFQPGLVGGHCIGVDPYYLTHKAQALGFHPEMILSGRRTNDGMGAYVAKHVIKMMAEKKIPLADARVLILGLTFKENCPDIRNTRVPDIVETLNSFGVECEVCDPRANAEEVKAEYGFSLVGEPRAGAYGAIILAVAHDEFKKLSPADIHAWGANPHVLFDVKRLLPLSEVDARL